MLKLISWYLIMFNCAWLLYFFIMLALHSSVEISEPSAWIAWIEVVFCFTSIPAIVYLMITGRR